jgi:hypothetical protein
MSDLAPTPQTDAYIGDQHEGMMTEGEFAMCEFARMLERERDELRQELDELKAGAVHSCHDQCQRPGCVRRRENEVMRVAIREANHILSYYRQFAPGLSGLDEDIWLTTTEASQVMSALTKLKPFTTP